jgi:hypothetical protein
LIGLEFIISVYSKTKRFNPISFNIFQRLSIDLK